MTAITRFIWQVSPLFELLVLGGWGMVLVHNLPAEAPLGVRFERISEDWTRITDEQKGLVCYAGRHTNAISCVRGH